MVINKMVMKRFNEFVKKLDELLNEFSDLPNEDVSDELEYRAMKHRK